MKWMIEVKLKERSILCTRCQLFSFTNLHPFFILPTGSHASIYAATNYTLSTSIPYNLSQHFQSYEEFLSHIQEYPHIYDHHSILYDTFDHQHVTLNME